MRLFKTEILEADMKGKERIKYNSCSLSEGKSSLKKSEKLPEKILRAGVCLSDRMHRFP